MKLTKFKLYYLNQALGYEWCDKTGWHHSINELKDQVFDGVLPNDRVNGEVIRVQFTGLTDKNKQEIYESDIVDYYGKILKVEYNNGRFFINHGFEDVEPNDLHNNADANKIIGNIYENPELLK